MPHCSKCGAAIIKSAKFCNVCGQKVVRSNHFPLRIARVLRSSKYNSDSNNQSGAKQNILKKITPKQLKLTILITSIVVATVSIFLILWFCFIRPAIKTNEGALNSTESKISVDVNDGGSNYENILTSITTYNADGEVIPSADSFSRIYDKNGILVSETGYRFVPLYSTSNYITIYDDVGRPESITLFYIGMDGILTHYRRSDIHGRKTADVYYTDAKEVDYQNSFFYSYYGSSRDPLVSDCIDDFSINAITSDMTGGFSTARVDSYYMNSLPSDTGLELYENFYDEHGNIVVAEPAITESPDNNGLKQTYGYDSSGKIITRIEETNSEFSRSICVYDINDNKLLSRIDYDGDGNLIYSGEYSYDSYNRLVKETFIVSSDNQDMFDMDTSYHSAYYSYAYDKFGNLVQKRLYRTDGAAVVYWNYSWDRTYDKNNNLVKQVYYITGSGSAITNVWEYDKNSVLLSETTYGSEMWATENFRTEYEYDENGSIKSITYFYDDPEDAAKFVMTERIEYSTNEAGNTVVEKGTYNEPGVLNEIESWEYSKDGRLLFQSSETSQGKTSTTYTYQSLYNQDGTLSRENNYQNGILTSYVEYSYSLDGDLLKKTNYNEKNAVENYTEYVYSYLPKNVNS